MVVVGAGLGRGVVPDANAVGAIRTEREWFEDFLLRASDVLFLRVAFFILTFSTLEWFRSLPMLARRNRVAYEARRRL